MPSRREQSRLGCATASSWPLSSPSNSICLTPARTGLTRQQAEKGIRPENPGPENPGPPRARRAGLVKASGCTAHLSAGLRLHSIWANPALLGLLPERLCIMPQSPAAAAMRGRWSSLFQQSGWGRCPGKRLRTATYQRSGPWSSDSPLTQGWADGLHTGVAAPQTPPTHTPGPATLLSPFSLPRPWEVLPRSSHPKPHPGTCRSSPRSGWS